MQQELGYKEITKPSCPRTVKDTCYKTCAMMRPIVEYATIIKLRPIMLKKFEHCSKK